MSTVLSSCVFLLVGVAGAAAQHGQFPWKAGDYPPPVAGVVLAASRARLDSLLGVPTDSQQLGADGWALNFRTRGVSVVYTPLDGAAVIYLLHRDAGDIGGVRLGDSKDSVIGKWGAPSTADGPNALYIAGKWVVVITFDSVGTRVVNLGLGRVAESGAVAVEQDSAPHKLPFTPAENLDGARFVAFVMTRAGLPSVYVAAKDFPTSTDYRQVAPDSARDGDVAWWRDFVAIYSASDRTLITPDGPLSLDILTARKGAAHFYRRLVPN